MEKKEEKIKLLTCTKCGDVKEMYCQITYSQGYRVCLSCKEELKESDKKAFDRDMNERRF